MSGDKLNAYDAGRSRKAGHAARVGNNLMQSVLAVDLDPLSAN